MKIILSCLLAAILGVMSLSSIAYQRNYNEHYNRYDRQYNHRNDDNGYWYNRRWYRHRQYNYIQPRHNPSFDFRWERQPHVWQRPYHPGWWCDGNGCWYQPNYPRN